MNTCIISGGSINHDFALDFMKHIKPDTIIAVDRGLVFAYQNHLPVDVIIGDFDSVPGDVLKHYQNQPQVSIRAYNPEKDATDTQIAIEQAVALGSKKIWILGGTGSRMDHCLGNINCLALALAAGIPAAIVDEHNQISLINQEAELARASQFGTYVSFLPFGETVTGLNLIGFKYPLTEHTLRNTDGLGISNEIKEEKAKVTFRSGTLIMIQSKD